MKNLLLLLCLSIFFLACQNQPSEKPEDSPTPSAAETALKSSLLFYSSFDQGFEADFAKGEAQIYTAPSYNEADQAQAGMSNDTIQRIAGDGVGGGAGLHFTAKTRGSVFYQSKGNISYKESDWTGSISLWLKLNPEEDLAPGYTDPIQITDSGYNDAAFWVDFSNKNPRSFRMGVYGDLSVWNPDNVGPDEDPNFNNRLLPAKDKPFTRESWTHVVVTFEGLNKEEAGTANFYINGIHQGTRSVDEPFTWDYDKSKIFLGLNYQGKLDELSIYNAALDQASVSYLYELGGGLGTLLN